MLLHRLGAIMGVENIKVHQVEDKQMKMKMRKTVAFLLVAAMLVMNMGAMVVTAANDEGGNKETAAEKAASPSANPKAGTYDAVQKVTLTSTTKDAVIYYTVNGDTPSEKSTKFDAKKPIEVKETSTVKAIAVKDGMTKSDVASFAYTIKADDKSETTPETSPAETAAATPAETAVPEATPAEETEKAPSEEDQATLSAPAEQENTGADESPAPTESTVPTESTTPTVTPAANEIGAVVISSDDKSAANIVIPSGSKLEDYNTVEKYKAFAEADRSTVDSVKWELTDKKADTPATAETVFTAGSKYICTVGVSAKAGFVFGNSSAFTMNGVTGTTESTDTAKREYKFAFTVPAAPTAEPATGATVKADSTIALTSADTGAVISYKVTADTDWSTYSADTKIAVKADADKKFKVTAKAVLNGFESAEAVFDYTVDTTVVIAPPTASPAGGTYTDAQTVTLKAADGVNIRYTTDGSDPTKTEGTLYNKSLTISKTTTVKAVAYTDDGISSVATFEYVIKEAAKKSIKKVSVLDVTGASRGVKPKEDASVSDSSHSIVGSVEWTDTEKNALDTSKVFKAGTIYYVYIHLEAEDGYEYDVDALKANSKDNVVVTINGNRASVSSVSETDLVVLGAFKTADAATAEGKNSTITGLSSAYAKGATITFTATGAGSTNPEKEGNERYIPIKYSVSNNSYEMSEGTPSIKKSIRISTSGTYTLKVTFQKEVYSADRNAWVRDDDTYEASASLKINASGTSTTPRTTTKAATTTPKTNSSKTKSTGAKTGDETPIGALAGVAVLAGAAVVVLLAAKKKKSKTNK